MHNRTIVSRLQPPFLFFLMCQLVLTKRTSMCLFSLFALRQPHQNIKNVCLTKLFHGRKNDDSHERRKNWKTRFRFWLKPQQTYSLTASDVGLNRSLVLLDWTETQENTWWAGFKHYHLCLDSDCSDKNHTNTNTNLYATEKYTLLHLVCIKMPHTINNTLIEGKYHDF